MVLDHYLFYQFNAQSFPPLIGISFMVGCIMLGEYLHCWFVAACRTGSHSHSCLKEESPSCTLYSCGVPTNWWYHHLTRSRTKGMKPNTFISWETRFHTTAQKRKIWKILQMMWKKLNEQLIINIYLHTFSSMFPWRLLCVSSPHSGTWQAP